MDIPAGPGGADAPVDAPWGINPATGRPYTKSPEERAAIGANLAAARQAKAAARRDQAADDAPDTAELPPVDRSTPDRAPGARPPRRRAGRRRAGHPAAGEKDETPIPPFRAGPIAKGMNRLYAKAGRLIRMANPMLGQAFISCTRKESDDDETIGEAWEALAQVSPVWRARLLKLVSGGAAGRVLMAHMPIVLALLALEPVAKRLPFGHIVEVLLGGDEPATPAGTATATAEPSFEDMMAMATQMMGPLMMQRAASMPRTPGWPAGENPDGSYGPAQPMNPDGTYTMAGEAA